MQFIQYRNTALLPILSVISPRSYNPTILSYIIHYAIIYYAPYNYISIMYISCIYHVSITYLSNIYYYIIYNTHIKNTCAQIQAWNIFYNLKYRFIFAYVCTLLHVKHYFIISNNNHDTTSKNKANRFLSPIIVYRLCAIHRPHHIAYYLCNVQ